ncbi:MAG: hypothetical protein KC619_12130 [Myxococcales bacterium]|nr:hypothetical protein [Myxococcales bacterium]
MLRRLAGALAVVGWLGLTAAPVLAQQQRPNREQIERARALFVRGSEHYQAGRLNEALEDFLASWRIVQSPELAYNVARTYERTADHNHAIQFYRHYLQRAAPDAAERADVERRIAEMEEITRRQRGQIRTLPPSQGELAQEARTFFERGVTMYRRRQYEAAMAAFTAAYNYTRPNPPAEVLYNLAMTCERLERRQDAIDYYREYARTLPRDSAERREIDAHVAELRAQR